MSFIHKFIIARLTRQAISFSIKLQRRNMKQDYNDILKIAGNPIFWDQVGVPRYEIFRPSLSADIYAYAVLLVEIACQTCNKTFDCVVSFQKLNTGSISLNLGSEIAYGDPPYHNHQAGESQTSIFLSIKEYWDRSGMPSGSWKNQETKKAILNLRYAVRWHRDQFGDDRCWLDDWRVYKFLPEGFKNELPSYEACMELCKQYKNFRTETKPPVPYESVTKNQLDIDLLYLSPSGLKYELEQICQAVRHHLNIGDGNRTASDDRLLYNILPDKIPANQSVPDLENCKKFIKLKIQELEQNPKASLHFWP